MTLSLIQKLGKRVELSAVWTYMSGSRMTVPTRKSFVITPDGDGTNDYDYIESRNNYKLPPTHRLDFNFSFHKQKIKTPALIKETFLIFYPSFSYTFKF